MTAMNAVSDFFDFIGDGRDKIEQDGNVPSRRHIYGSIIFDEQLLETFGKKISKKVFLEKNFSKNVFFNKVGQCRKTQKRPFRLIQCFHKLTNRKLKKNAMGYPSIEFENFRKKVA